VLAGLGRIVGGYALSRRDLRLLYAAVFLSFLGASITFPLRLLYAQAHHASPAQLGLLAGAFLLAPLLAQLPMGWLVDRWGRVPVLLIGLIAHPIISLLYIPLNGPWELIALRFLEGITVSAFQPAIGAYIADVTPEKHRSEAYGALGATLNAGMLIGPFFGGVIGQYFGFTVAFLVNFLVEAVAIPLVLGHVREPLHEVHQERSESTSWRDLFSIPLAGVYIAYFTMQVVMGVLGSLWSIWLHDLGGSYTYIGLTFSVFALPQIFFGTSAGRLADRFGRAPFLLVSGVIAGLIYASYGFVTDLALIMALGVIEGIVIVFQQPVAQGLLADASPARVRGRVQGVAGAMGAVGGSIAAFASLPLYHTSRAIPFTSAGVIMGAGSAIVAASAVVFVRRRRAEALVLEAEQQTA
jgi:MFS family permease